MSHLPPKPDFDYPARYPAEPRHFPRPPPPPAVYPPTPERYPPRDRPAYPPPRSPPRSRAPPVDTYVPARPVDAYRSTRPPPPTDPYPSSCYDRRDDDRHRDREYERRGNDYRLRPRDDYSRDRERVRGRDRRWEDDTRGGHTGERRERDTSRERQLARQREEDKERRERAWARQREDDRGRQEREWVRQRDEDRRYGRDRMREIEPERKWVPRMSRSPPRRIVSAKLPEQSPAPSRARSPAASESRRGPPTPLHVASRAGSPYRVERSRPLRSRSPPGEVRLGNHSISVSRNSARPRRDPSPRENDRDRRQPSLRRSRSPDRSRREVRRDVSRGSRTAPSDYRGHERRSPRRRTYSPVSPPRRKSPKPARRRTPSPSRSRSRSPTRTPPTKRHVLPPLKSPSRPPPPPPPTGPRIRAVQPPKTDADDDVNMEEPFNTVPVVSARAPSTSPAEASASTPAPVPASVSPQPQSAAPSPVSPTAKPVPATASLPPKPEVEVDRNLTRPRRRSRSPPTGPRHHHHYHGPIPSNKSPAQGAHGGPNLPSRPDWIRRTAGRDPAKPDVTVSAPAPGASTAPSEPGAFVPTIPPYQPSKSITADLEADIARLRAHRAHIENEYTQIAKETYRALNDLMIADIDLKNAEARRAVTSAHLEKARVGKLGIDFIAGA